MSNLGKMPYVRPPCELVLGEERGRRVHALVEESLGGPCPCLSAGACPLVGRVAGARLTIPVDELEPLAGA